MAPSQPSCQLRPSARWVIRTADPSSHNGDRANRAASRSAASARRISTALDSRRCESLLPESRPRHGRRVTAPLRSRPARYGTVLRNREFSGLVVAHTVSLLGTTIAAVALAVLIFERTRSPFLSSLTFALGFTP